MHKIVYQTGINSPRIVLGLQLLLIHADKLFTAARILAKTVVSDSVKPCGKARFTTKALDVLISPEKSFLRQIVGEGDICACELPKQTAHARLMPPHQFAVRVLIVICKNVADEHGNSN